MEKPIEKVWLNPDLRKIIEDYLRCIWCSRVPINHYHNISNWDLLENGKCIPCLIKEYSAYL